MTDRMKYAHLITVPRGSVTETEKMRVVKDFEALGCGVVFLEYQATSTEPHLHVVVGERFTNVTIQESDGE